jgi:hypothetical protein
VGKRVKENFTLEEVFPAVEEHNNKRNQLTDLDGPAGGRM